ncbi:MAG: hypothetical protein V4713_12770 [Pseudomonadota bacterium]
MRTRHRYIPISDVQVGMTLGAPLNVVQRGILSLTLPDGHVLTEENMGQLGAHAAEFMCITETDTRSDEEVAQDATRATARVRQIFDGADLNDSTLATLFDQVLAYRSA